jgi:hypothetical protein
VTHLDDLETEVLVRKTTATTFHFGRVTPICERRPTDGEAQPDVMSVAEAAQTRKRLCNDCADLVSQWVQAALIFVGETKIQHPRR